MISNLSEEMSDLAIDYPLLDKQLSFSEYINRCQTMIRERRPDLNGTKKPIGNTTTQQILSANSPYEIRPNNRPTEGKTKNGVLLVHGLFDSPFSLLDLGQQLQANGILSRSILLPGHGTQPQDLLKVHYQNWIDAVNYGVQGLQEEVENVFIMGFSTGAALAVQQAIQNQSAIKGIILLAPAIKIKVPVDIVVAWQYFLTNFRNNKEWIYLEDEINYAKYLSIPFNAVYQVSNLTKVIDELNLKSPVPCPIFMAVSREDETISSHTAIDFFDGLHHEKSRLLLYTSYDHKYPDKRVLTRDTNYPKLNIKHFSHIALPFAPSNSHYGQQGDYPEASHIGNKGYLYGAYNRIEVSMFDTLNRLGLAKYKRHELTYNPDFDFLAEQIVEFILN